MLAADLTRREPNRSLLCPYSPKVRNRFAVRGAVHQEFTDDAHVAAQIAIKSGRTRLSPGKSIRCVRWSIFWLLHHRSSP